MAGDSSSAEGAPKGEVAVMERGEQPQERVEVTTTSTKVSKSRTRTYEPETESRTDSSDDREKPDKKDEKTKREGLFKALGMSLKELTALFKMEEKSGKVGNFQGDILWFMAGTQKNPIHEWDAEILHEQILRFQGHLEDPLYGEIAGQVLDEINKAVTKKCRTAEDPQALRAQIYRGEKRELPPVRVDPVDHAKVRGEMEVEASDIRALASQREKEQREKIRRAEEKAKEIEDEEEREKELKALHRAKGFVADIEGTDFVVERSQEEKHQLALRQGRRADGYGIIAGEYGAYEERGEFAGDDGDDYYEEKQKLLNQDNWEDYGWSRDDKNDIKRLIVSTRMEDSNAENVMAAMLLHGMTAEEVLSILAAKDEQGHPQVGAQLDRILRGKSILKNDDEVMDIIFTNPDDKTNFITNIMYYEPQNFEDTVFQIAFESRTNTIFNRRGAMAVLTNKVNRRKVRDPETGREIIQFDFWEKVDADAVFTWFFASAMEAHGNHTTSALDFEQQVQVKKGAASVPITVYEMMLGRLGNMFRSKYGNKDRNGWVADDLEALSVILSETRNSGIEKQQRMGDVKQLEELAYKELVNNNMTRDVGGLSLLELMARISEVGNRTEKGDGKVGAMILTTYAAYCNINNLEGMAETFGLLKNHDGKMVGDVDELAEVFNLKNFVKARDDALRGRRNNPALKNTTIPDPDKKVMRNGKEVSQANEWLDFTEDGVIEMDEHTRDGVKHNKVKISALFDAKTGKAKLGNGPRLAGESQKAYEERCLAERKNFILFINFLTHVTPEARLETVVRRLIQNQAAKLHGMRDTKGGVGIPGTSDYAEMVAHGMLYRFGMYFYLDNSMSGRSEEGKRNAAYLRDRVKKDAHAGNLFLLGVMPNWLLPEALVVSTTSIDPRTGRPMNMQNALMDIQRVRMKMDKEINDRVEREIGKEKWQNELTEKMKKMDRKTAEAELRADIRDYLFQHDDETQKALKDYNSAATQLKFREGVERNYLQDHWQKGMGMDERLTGAHGFDFSDYIHHDAVSGPTVKAEKLVKDLAKFFNQMRKFQVGTDWYYGTPIPQWNEKTQTMEMRPLGESVIGRQVIKQIMSTNKKFRNPDGSPNWKEINESGQVAKWMEAAFISAQMLQYTERAEWNLNPRYAYSMRESILEIMEKLPGEFHVDPDDMRASHQPHHKEYFSHEMMKWIRKTSGTNYWKSFFLEATANILLGTPGKKDGLFSGFADMWNIFAKASLQGVGS